MTEIARWRNSACYVIGMARIDEVLAGEATWGKYALDVLGHTGLGAAYTLAGALPTLLLGGGLGLAAGIGSGLSLAGGAVREILQASKTGKLHLFDRVLDTLHHLLGVPLGLGLSYLAVQLFK
jgi:hypothetical protein